MADSRIVLDFVARIKGDLAKHFQRLTSTGKSAAKSTERMDKSVKKLKRSAASTAKTLQGMRSQFLLLGTNIQGMVALLSGATVKAFVDMTDQWERVRGQIALYIGDVDKANDQMEEFIRIGTRVGANIDLVSQAFNKAHVAVAHLGVSADDVNTIVEGMGLALRDMGEDLNMLPKVSRQMFEAVATGKDIGASLERVLKRGSSERLIKSIGDELIKTNKAVADYSKQGKSNLEAISQAFRDGELSAQDYFKAAKTAFETRATAGDDAVEIGHAWDKAAVAVSGMIGRLNDAFKLSQRIAGEINDIADDLNVLNNFESRYGGGTAAGTTFTAGRARISDREARLAQIRGRYDREEIDRGQVKELLDVLYREAAEDKWSQDPTKNIAAQARTANQQDWNRIAEPLAEGIKIAMATGRIDKKYADMDTRQAFEAFDDRELEAVTLTMSRYNKAMIEEFREFNPEMDRFSKSLGENVDKIKSAADELLDKDYVPAGMKERVESTKAAYEQMGDEVSRTADLLKRDIIPSDERRLSMLQATRGQLESLSIANADLLKKYPWLNELRIKEKTLLDEEIESLNKKIKAKNEADKPSGGKPGGGPDVGDVVDAVGSGQDGGDSASNLAGSLDKASLSAENFGASLESKVIADILGSVASQSKAVEKAENAYDGNVEILGAWGSKMLDTAVGVDHFAKATEVATFSLEQLAKLPVKAQVAEIDKSIATYKEQERDLIKARERILAPGLGASSDEMDRYRARLDHNSEELKRVREQMAKAEQARAETLPKIFTEFRASATESINQAQADLANNVITQDQFDKIIRGLQAESESTRLTYREALRSDPALLDSMNKLDERLQGLVNQAEKAAKRDEERNQILEAQQELATAVADRDRALQVAAIHAEAARNVVNRGAQRTVRDDRRQPINLNMHISGNMKVDIDDQDNKDLVTKTVREYDTETTEFLNAG